MSHEFSYWKKYYQQSLNNGYKVKDRAKVPNEELAKELKNMQNVLNAYDYYNNEENIANEGLIEY